MDSEREPSFRCPSRPRSPGNRSPVRSPSPHSLPDSALPFPLSTVTTHDLHALVQALWDWTVCDSCANSPSKPCHTRSCTWRQRGAFLASFFDFYRDLARSYVPDFLHGQALRSHRDLHGIIRFLRTSEHGWDRDRCLAGAFVHRSDPSSQVDQERALDLAVRIMTMVRFVNRAHDTLQVGSRVNSTFDVETSLGRGARSLSWSKGKSLEEVIEAAFPSVVHPSLQPGDRNSGFIKVNLTGARLTRLAGLKIEGTDDLREHLKLDQVAGVVYLFHHTAFLRESLLAGGGRPEGLEPEEGTVPIPRSDPGLPRAVALEALYTLQLLFPDDVKSQSLLRNLVSKHGFDPDILRLSHPLFPYGGCGDEEQEHAQRFPAFGSRLMDMYDEIENPRPRSALDAWLERKSKSRHVMLVTMAGVLTAVILGVLSLFVSIFQAWIAWQGWKSSAGT